MSPYFVIAINRGTAHTAVAQPGNFFDEPVEYFAQLKETTENPIFVDSQEWHKLDWFGATSEENARTIAEMVLFNNPGKQVVIAKSQFMIDVKAPTFVTKQFTEQGVVPV
jgi:hypothetical protein